MVEDLLVVAHGAHLRKIAPLSHEIEAGVYVHVDGKKAHVRVHAGGVQEVAVMARDLGGEERQGHVAANFLAPDPFAPPFICLLASGGQW